MRAYVSGLEIFCECSCFDFGNFRFKLPKERIFKEGEDGTGVFVIKTIRFVKIRCHRCGYITLIPTYGEFRVTGPVHCADCGKRILIKYY
jgi:DNA-directed RNA polymerase subunit RPC12/RpoP